jgi:TonB family protein
MPKRSHTSLKAFVLTLFLYSSAILAAVWQLDALTYSEKTPNVRELPINISMYQTPTPVKPVKAIEPPKPKPPEPIEETVTEPEPVAEIPKPTPKPVTKPKPVKQPKPEPKKVVKKEVKKVVKKPVEKPKKVVKKTPTKPVKKVAKDTTPKVVEPQPVEKTITEQPTPPTYSASQVADAEDRYLSELSRTLAQLAQDSYPRRAKRRHWEGEVVLKFVLYRNGDIKHLQIVDGDRRTVLNDAAVGIIKDRMGMRFKPFYKEIERNQWHLTVPVNFSLN